MALVGAQFVNAVSPNPVGSLQAYAGASAPTGWLLCDGTSYSTSVYPELFSVLGYTYGGSGANFNVPDLRGRMPMGAGTGAGLNASGTGAPSGTAMTTRTRGQWGGEETHLLTGSESGTSAHNHATSRVWTDIAGSHQHNYRDLFAAGQVNYALGTDTNSNGMSNSAEANAVSRHNTVPPFLVTNYIIKAVPDAPRSGLAYGSTPPIVTALPANPQFGDVVTYVAASSTNGTSYQWNGSSWYAIGDRVAQVTQSAGSQTLTGLPLALTGMSYTGNFVGRPVRVGFSTYLDSGGVGQWVSFRVTLDGVAQGYDRAVYLGTSQNDTSPCWEWMFTPTAGSRTIAVVAQSSSSSTYRSLNRQMIVTEF